MSSRTLYRDFAIVVGLTAALPLWAKPLKKTIELYSPARVGNTALPAGQYEAFVSEKTVIFEKDNKVVAEAPYQWKQIPKSPKDEMWFDKDRLTEIDFSGKSQAIEFIDNSSFAITSSFGSR